MAITTINEPITAYDYIVKNWNKYGITDIKKSSDMVELLNILQANGENLDSFHDVVINGTQDGFFCSIYGEYEDDNDLYNTLTSLHIFFPTYEALQEHLKEVLDDMGKDTPVDEYIKSEWEDIRRTRDGYVLKIWC